MKKGIIADICDNKAIILTENGEFTTVPNRNYSIGQSVSYKNKTLNNFVSLAACFFAAVAIGVGGFKLYFTPTSYVDVDINPSLRLDINIFNRVIKITALNNDGKILIENSDNIPRFIDKCIVTITENSKKMGYINPDNSDINVVVISKNKSTLEKVKKCEQIICDKDIQFTVELESNDTLEKARENNISVGRFKIIEDYAEKHGGKVEDISKSLQHKTNDEIKEITVSDERPADNFNEQNLNETEHYKNSLDEKENIYPDHKNNVGHGEEKFLNNENLEETHTEHIPASNAPVHTDHTRYEKHKESPSKDAWVTSEDLDSNTKEYFNDYPSEKKDKNNDYTNDKHIVPEITVPDKPSTEDIEIPEQLEEKHFEPQKGYTADSDEELTRPYDDLDNGEEIGAANGFYKNEQPVQNEFPHNDFYTSDDLENGFSRPDKDGSYDNHDNEGFQENDIQEPHLDPPTESMNPVFSPGPDNAPNQPRFR